MTDHPDLAALLAPVLAQIPPADQPLFIALLERAAAARYREWATTADAELAVRLQECAAREDEIASRVEALRADAADVQAQLAAAHPSLGATVAAVFDPLPVPEQYALQAGGERLGAATWRSFAKAALAVSDDRAAVTFTECAALEEASAEVLEAALRG